MLCIKCGTQNNDASKFCIGCGHNLLESQTNQTFNSVNSSNIEQSSQMNYTQPSQMNYDQPSAYTNYNQMQPLQTGYAQSSTQTNSYNNTSVKMSISEYFFILLAVILKPFTAFKQELNKFNSFKNSAVMALIVSIIATLASLVKTMINAVRVTGYWTHETKWVWDNLKNINYIKTIGTNLLIYLGIIAAITCVYYIGSLIAKKQVNFSRLLGISAFAVVPMIVCSLIISPLLSSVYAPLGMGVTILGFVYTIIIIYEIINSEIGLDGNAKLYFNLICMSILAISGYYLYIRVLVGSVTSGIENALDMFKY